MISEPRFRTLVREQGVATGLTEKNYVNSWVLYGIYTPPLGDALVFKGGTALSKLYFPAIWRFSEDLDFTATEEIPQFRDQLEDALAAIEAEPGIVFAVTDLHEAGDPVEYMQVDVQYDAMLGQRNTDIDDDLSLPVSENNSGL